jgi:hypothetical protein
VGSRARKPSKIRSGGGRFARLCRLDPHGGSFGSFRAPRLARRVWRRASDPAMASVVGETAEGDGLADPPGHPPTLAAHLRTGHGPAPRRPTTPTSVPDPPAEPCHAPVRFPIVPPSPYTPYSLIETPAGALTFPRDTVSLPTGPRRPNPHDGANRPKRGRGTRRDRRRRIACRSWRRLTYGDYWNDTSNFSMRPCEPASTGRSWKHFPNGP